MAFFAHYLLPLHLLHWQAGVFTLICWPPKMSKVLWGIKLSGISKPLNVHTLRAELCKNTDEDAPLIHLSRQAWHRSAYVQKKQLLYPIGDATAAFGVFARAASLARIQVGVGLGLVAPSAPGQFASASSWHSAHFIPCSLQVMCASSSAPQACGAS